MKRCLVTWVLPLLMVVGGLRAYAAEEKPAPPAQAAPPSPLTVAVLGFATGASLPKDMGANLSTLLSAYLSTDTEAQMVEREDLLNTLGEQGLSLSGMVSANDAVKVGHLMGANVLVTGRAFSLGGSDMTVVVKIIGSETGRVYGRVVKSKGPQDVDGAVKLLSSQIADVLNQYGKSFVVPTEDEKARMARTKKAVGDQKLPQVCVLICERHTGPVLIDPAAETEVNFYLQGCGVKLIDHDPVLRRSWASHFKQDGLNAVIPEDMKQQADIIIVGEALSEFALRKGDLISCTGRVELKAVDTVTGEILAVDRESTAGVDITESAAAKKALQQAAATLAERDIPLMVKNWNKAAGQRAARAKPKAE